jgi:outer membrane protein assembly factor BamB/tetratricopeptide (TPR) repeat protein
MSLNGNIEEIGIGEVIQTISLNQYEGTLVIRGEKVEKLFYLSQGECSLVLPGESGAFKLGDLLLKSRKITMDALETARLVQKEKGIPFGKALLSMDVVTEDDIDEVVEAKFKEDFFDVFLMRRGEFAFHFGQKPEDLLHEEEVVSKVCLNTQGLIMEALRQVDEWGRMRRKIRTPKAIFTIVDESPEALEDIDLPEQVLGEMGLIDGRRNVIEILRDSIASKFDTFSLLYELLEHRVIRPLTIDELKTHGMRCEEAGDNEQALKYFDFAVFMARENLELRDHYYRILKKSGQTASAFAEGSILGDLCYKKGRLSQALGYYQAAKTLRPKDVRINENVFYLQLKLGKTDYAMSQGMTLGGLLLKAGEPEKAKETYEKLLEMDRQNTSIRMSLAEVYEALGDKERALELYMEVTQILASKTESLVLVELYRKILDLDPSRKDIRAELNRFLAKKSEKRWIGRLTVGVIAAFLLVGFLAIVLFYEISARRSLRDAEAAAKEALAEKDFSKAQHLYDKVSKRFPYSLIVDRARLKASEARTAELALKMQRKDMERVDERQAKKLERLREERKRKGLFEEAGSLLNAGDLEKASERLMLFLQRYPTAPQSKTIRIPVVIRTEPPGAEVLINGESAGKSPLRHMARPHAKLRIELKKTGYAPEAMCRRADRFVSVEKKLKRAPLWTFKAQSAIDTQPRYWEKRLYFTCRDGCLYCLNAETGAYLFHRHVDRFGASIPAPVIRNGKIYVGNNQGAFCCLSTSDGGLIWKVHLYGESLSEASLSPGGSVVSIGCRSGKVYFLGAEKAALMGSFCTLNRVEAPPLLLEDRAFVGSWDNRLYAWNYRRGGLLWEAELGDDIRCGPVLWKDLVLVGSIDGRVSAYEANQGAHRWTFQTGAEIRARPLSCEAGVFVASSDGALYALSPADGSLKWRFDSGAPLLATPVAYKEFLYMGNRKGDFICLRLADGQPVWREGIGAPIAASPCEAGGKIFVATRDGTLYAYLP